MQETDSLRENLLDSNKTDDSCIYFSTNGLESAQRDVLDLSLGNASLQQVPQMMNIFGFNSIVNNCEDNTTIFDDNSYYLKNYVYKLLPITFEDIDEEIIHKEHDYCSISSNSDKEGEFSKTMDLSLIKNRVYKKKKERSSKQKNASVENGHDKNVAEACNSPLESITANCEEEDPHLLDLDFSLINYRSRFDYSNLLQPLQLISNNEEKTDAVAEGEDDSNSMQLCVPEATADNEASNNIMVDIKCPINKNYQPTKRFKCELAYVVSLLARNNHDKINFIDLRIGDVNSNEGHKTNYLLTNAAWKSFKSSSERVILTNDKSICKSVSKNEEDDSQTFYILNEASLQKLLKSHSEEIGASLNYRVLNDFSGSLIDISEIGESDNSEVNVTEVEVVNNENEEQSSGIINSGLLKILLSKSSILNFKNTIGNLIGRIKCNECIEEAKPCERCMEQIDKTNLNKTSPNSTDDSKRNLPSKKYWSRMVDIENILNSNPIVKEMKSMEENEKKMPKKRGRKKKEKKCVEKEAEKVAENVEMAGKSGGIINSGILKSLLKNSNNNFVDFGNQKTESLVEECGIDRPNQVSNSVGCLSPERGSCITVNGSNLVNGEKLDETVTVGEINGAVGEMPMEISPSVNSAPENQSPDKDVTPKNSISGRTGPVENSLPKNQTPKKIYPVENFPSDNPMPREFHPLMSSSPKNKISSKIFPPKNQIPDKVCPLENFLPKNEIPNEILPAKNSSLENGEPSQINESLKTVKTKDKKKKKTSKPPAVKKPKAQENSVEKGTEKKKKPSTVKKARRSLEISVEEIADQGLGVEKRTRSGRDAPEASKKAKLVKKPVKVKKENGEIAENKNKSGRRTGKEEMLKKEVETEFDRQSILEQLLLNAAEKIKEPEDSSVLCDILPSMENLNIPMTKTNKKSDKKKNSGRKKKKRSKSREKVNSNGTCENSNDQRDLNKEEPDQNYENLNQEKNDDAKLNFLGFNHSDILQKDNAVEAMKNLSNNLSDSDLSLDEYTAKGTSNFADNFCGDYLKNGSLKINTMKELILEANENTEDSNISTTENNSLVLNGVCAEENSWENEMGTGVMSRMKITISGKMKTASNRITDSAVRELRRGRGRPRKSSSEERSVISANCRDEPCLENENTVVSINNSFKSPLGDIEEDFQEIKMQLEKEMNERPKIKLNGTNSKESEDSTEDLEDRPLVNGNDKVEPFRNRLRSTKNRPVKKTELNENVNEKQLNPENVQETPKVNSKNLKKRKFNSIYTHSPNKKIKVNETVENPTNESVHTSQENKNTKVKFDPEVTWKVISPLMGYGCKDMSAEDGLNTNFKYERKTRSGRSISNDADPEDVEIEPPKKKLRESSVFSAEKLEPKPETKSEVVFDKKSILRGRRTIDSTPVEKIETQTEKSTAVQLVVNKKEKEVEKNKVKKDKMKKKIRSSARLKKTLKNK